MSYITDMKFLIAMEIWWAITNGMSYIIDGNLLAIIDRL